ncbi:conserved Plasmodium protein, unknown function [Plasmodium ovale]|uniref:Uncharacterized protein n=2 Tax=Plasmodium ovale TaxID=36330 RepID=A0A1A8VYB9_PLAOA|nr:conserved Plasmodium protein, unknown function [Plasmodium ovale curtisi]SCP04663.1 conserved Plasmodium protein, unknown function [Plasmodium ovale]
MINLAKSCYFLCQNERKINFHRMKITDIIKLINRNRDMKQDDFENINIQIINTINNINPQKIIYNIVCNNVREKHDLKSLKKKIYLNHLLLRTILNGNHKHFQLYECKENESDNNSEEKKLRCYENVISQQRIYGRHRKKIMPSRKAKGNGVSEEDVYDRRVNNDIGEPGVEIQHRISPHFLDMPVTNESQFEPFELAKNYGSYILGSILKHICFYIYNYKTLNEINREEKNGHELVSVLLMSNMFHNFFELKFGYTYLTHFFNGLKMYRIKEDIQIDQMDFKWLDDNIKREKEERKHIFEKEYDVSFIIEYLTTWGSKNEHNHVDDGNGKVHDQNSNMHECNSFMHKFEEEGKKTVYIVNTKQKIVLHYDINESYLNYFLKIIGNKYNVEKISFNNYCLLMHMYSMCNHFVINFFYVFPLLFLKNKMYTNMNTLIIVLNSCLFFLKGKSFISTHNSFHIYIKSDDCNHLIEQKDHIHILKEKVYTSVEQLINHLLQNKEIMKNNHLLQILEIFSYIQYNKIFFSYIFNKINNNLCLLDKHQIFYFLHSLSNYNMLYNDAKKRIYTHATQSREKYSAWEIKQLERHLQGELTSC